MLRAYQPPAPQFVDNRERCPRVFTILIPVQRYLLLIALAGARLFAADGSSGALDPVTVCELLAHTDTLAGQPVLVVGRYSYREYGRFLSEKGCVLRVVLDAKNGPLPPDSFSVDAAAASRKLAIVRKSTALGAFRFGSSDYDRWALIYGRVVSGPPPQKHSTAREFDEDARPVLCRSQTLVIFLREQ